MAEQPGPVAARAGQSDGVLVLHDGTVFRGMGIGATGQAVGEV